MTPDEEGGQKVSISAGLHASITQLSDQLQNEAAAAFDAIRAEMAEQYTAHERVRVGLEAQLSSARDQLDAVSRHLASSQRELAGLNDQLGDDKIARHTAEQRSLDLGERLADAERHQASPEERHRHARDALEHYRGAWKEQREQEPVQLKIAAASSKRKGWGKPSTFTSES